jgi:hypothetical protein
MIQIMQKRLWMDMYQYYWQKQKQLCQLKSPHNQYKPNIRHKFQK